jgi:GSH-dependent disulfide-bond oxidoreductase
MLRRDAWSNYPNLKRLFDEISARPAAARVATLKDKFEFKAVFDEEARHFMFPQNARLAI